MTKHNEIAKDKAIAEILLVVAEKNTLDILREKTTAICKKYFPKADRVFENVMIDFAYSAQSVNFARKLIYTEVNRYEREERKKAV